MDSTFNPQLDLSFERSIDVPPELVWKAWTQPENLKPWFCPLPWKTVDCEVALHPGGLFRTVMLSPEGQKFPNVGCYLEVVQNERLTWTNALLPGFRPAPLPRVEETGAFFFTATIALAPHGNGTHYTATVRHADLAGYEKHKAMGFEQGWGKALEQLVAYVKSTLL